jgi:glycosyltransferase involved in cell wall biosynthesis
MVKLSIVIITKNEEKCLPRLLRSIRRQNFSREDYEIIVADAQSCDLTREIAQAFDCRIVEGGMPSVGRNNGALATLGEIIIFMDADGMIPPGFLKKIVREFEKRNLSSATTFYKPMSRKTIDRIAYKVYSFWAFFMQYLSPYAGGFFIIVKKEVYKKAQGFNEGIVFTEDHEFVKSCSKFGKFRILYSSYVLGDMRRIKKDGRIRFFIKLLTAAVYRIFIGKIKGNIFEYGLHGNNRIKKKK